MKRAQKRKARKRVQPLKVYRENEAREDADGEPDREDHPEQTGAEEFWAGRNHAMRQSARVAA